MKPTAWLDAVSAWVEDFIQLTGVPRSVALFVLVLLLGFAAAVVARRITRKLVLRSAGLLARVGRASLPPDMDRLASPVGTTVFWLILLLTVMTATEMLGLPVVTTWLSRVASYVPRIIAAIFISVLGLLVARIARRIVAGAARSAHLPASERIGRAAEVALMIGVGLVAVEQLGIEVSLLTTVILIVLSAVFGSAALAFGLGGREWVANVLSAHYVERLYQVGQTIRVRDIEGRILRITETSVILECRDGEIALPAREFASAPSTLVLRSSSAKGRVS